MREQILEMASRYISTPMRPSGGNNVLTICPFHKGGQEKTPSFSIDVVRGIFHCFTCHEAGDLRKMLRLMNVPRSHIDREFQVIQPFLDRERENYFLNKKTAFHSRDMFRADFILPEEILGIYEWCPTNLLEAGFDQEMMRKLDIGFDRNTQRVMYPLRDMYGNLAGFSGGATTKDVWPKYKVYQGRRRGIDGRAQSGDFGEWFDEKFPAYVMKNHDFLWNFDRVWPRIMDDNNTTLYVVEGFKACMWMLQNGFENTVALMGSYISERQQYMIHRLGCTIAVCLDNDAPGRRASFTVADLLWRPMHGKIKVMVYPEGEDDTQPDDYDGDSLRELTTNAVPFISYVNAVRKGHIRCQ